MANNELSGIVVSSYIANWIANKKDNRFSYRFVFIPETIGSITYLSKNIKRLKSKVVAGYNITCVGDNRGYSYLPSRNGNTISDLVGKHVLKHIDPAYKIYEWKDRGSDERQYCSPGVDLPIATIMRTKYGMYEEYHTSLDDLVNVVTPEGLQGGYNIIKLAIEALENNKYPKVNFICEPQLGKRGMYPTLSTKASSTEVNLIMDIISYSDGNSSLIEIAELCKVPIWQLYPIIEQLTHNNLITVHEEKNFF
jgi:aminopeptidase-like protein